MSLYEERSDVAISCAFPLDEIPRQARDDPRARIAELPKVARSDSAT